MDRRSIPKNDGFFEMFAAVVDVGDQAQAATVLWHLASSVPKSLTTTFGAAETIAKKVGEMSGGKFVITKHAACELMPTLGVSGGVQNGIVEACRTPFLAMSKRLH